MTSTTDGAVRKVSIRTTSATSPTKVQDIEGRQMQTIAGVTVADTPLVAAAIDYARRLSEPYLFNHAMRSWRLRPLLRAWRQGRIDG
jgi:hypothetical protein